MIDKKIDCPNCVNEAFRESVDVGVGVIFGPYGCYCGWSENDKYNLLTGPKITEKGGILDQWGGLTPKKIK